MNKYQQIFDKQKAYFNIDATKSYEWRIDQLNRMQQMLRVDYSKHWCRHISRKNQ